MTRHAFVAALAVLAILAAGCAKEQTVQPSDDPGNIISGAPRPERSGASGIKDHVVYFDFDSAVINEDGRELITTWAQFLAGKRDARVVLEGHCDERGTPEYNVALGERRALAVHALLTQQGVQESQIAVTSLGEERPVDAGHNERAWRKNRRVEILD